MIELLAGIAVGAVLGLTGAGGSLLAFPILLNGLGLPAPQAGGMALAMVAASAWSGVFARVSRQEIAWPPALVFAASGALASPLGRRLAHEVPEVAIVLGFSALSLVIAARMLLLSIRHPEQAAVVRATSGGQLTPLPPCTLYVTEGGRRVYCWEKFAGIVLGGVAAGVLSGFFGVGGGFIVVPVLVLITGISIAQAVGSSIFIVAAISSAGFLAYLQQAPEIPWQTLLWVCLGGVLGMLAGTLGGRRIAGPGLQRVFALVVLLAAVWNVVRLS